MNNQAAGEQDQLERPVTRRKFVGLTIGGVDRAPQCTIGGNDGVVATIKLLFAGYAWTIPL